MKTTGLVVAILVGLAVAVVVFFVRSGQSADTSETSPYTGGRLVATYRTEPRTFNRLASSRAAEALMGHLIHATLIRVDRTSGRLEPRLARAWTSSADLLRWTFTLQEGVTFSDGTPFTSADVVFTFQALYDKRAASEMTGGFLVGGQPLSVTAPDPATVVLSFPAPYGPGITLLDSLPILPRHRLQPALDSGTFAQAWSVTTPLDQIAGLGPFVLREYVPGSRLTFARNPRFWRRDAEGRPFPYLDEIQVDIVPETNAEVLRLEAGNADLINDAVRPEDLAALRQRERQGVVRLIDAGVSIDVNGLWFNLVPGAAPARQRAWLQRAELRRAISHAVNRQAIVDTVYLGAAVPVHGPITPGHGEWYVPDLPRTDHDPARAKELLASIGLTDRTGDGILDDEAGKPARLSVLTQKGHTILERTMAVVQQQLRQVGLALDVVAIDAGALISRFMKSDYDTIYFFFRSDSTDPARTLEFWMSSGSFHFWHPGQKTPATSWEAKIDDLMRRQSTSLDAAERRRLFAEAQRVLAGHLPILHFAAPRVTVATSSRLSGATPSILHPPVLWNPEVLFLAPPAAGRRP